MRFRSLSDAVRRQQPPSPAKSVPPSHPLAATLGTRMPDVEEIAPESVLRWGDGSVWGSTPVSAYVYPNQTTDPDGEWS